jgi:hypothetical protein
LEKTEEKPENRAISSQDHPNQVIVENTYEHTFDMMVLPDGACPRAREVMTMAKNTGEGFGKGEVRRRNQVSNPLTDGFTTRNTETGRFI